MNRAERRARIAEMRKKIPEVIDALRKICPDREVLLNVLQTVVAALLKEQKMNEQEVTAYLIKITQMLDGVFDEPEVH